MGYESAKNAFNGDTFIRFLIPQDAARVELEVFNLAGQKVTTLVQGENLHGIYELRWDGIDRNGRELASGVYLYQLRAGTFVETRRMLLLR